MSNTTKTTTTTIIGLPIIHGHPIFRPRLPPTSSWHIAQLFSKACPSPAPPIHVAKAVYEVWAPSKAHTCSDGRTG